MRYQAMPAGVRRLWVLGALDLTRVFFEGRGFAVERGLLAAFAPRLGALADFAPIFRTPTAGLPRRRDWLGFDFGDFNRVVFLAVLPRAPSEITAWAAARQATGTRKGEQLT